MSLGLVAPLLAQAQPVSGLYIAGGGGATWLQDADLTPRSGLALAGAGTGSASFNTGYTVVGSLGWGYGNGFRAEIEGNYHRNDVDEVSGFGALPRPLSSSGHHRSYAAMANLFYDFIIPDAPVIPYLGAGLGYGWTNYETVRVRGANGTALEIIGTEGRFAYQGIAGLAVPIAASPGLSLTAEYRYFGTLEPSLATTYISAATGTRRISTETQVNTHSVLLGLRYAFNAPRPVAPVAVAPAPAAAPAPARTYLVFFDFDRADLTDRARQIIAEAAQAVTTTGTTRIEVAGHADRSGTPQYNQRLSQRRAEAVAAELSRRGIARSQMSIQAFGESRPLVPTADGVREPQNRRVEIVLR
ncbi:OmpA family protein [Roseomonas nepalensis]|uniref:OmpA family protein n=1 Tax=Muricoccus nepalensis TaxID=1854500 RepID=A0A502G1M6_9PROT|nr:OmpA family protein [Roseomonas nepalensis]TPG55511.1 OmpA family protein [Roseomonas nepalensis]